LSDLGFLSVGAYGLGPRPTCITATAGQKVIQFRICTPLLASVDFFIFNVKKLFKHGYVLYNNKKLIINSKYNTY